MMMCPWVSAFYFYHRYVFIVLLMSVKCKHIYILQNNYSASSVLLYNGRLKSKRYQHLQAKCEEIGNVKTISDGCTSLSEALDGVCTLLFSVFWRHLNKPLRSCFFRVTMVPFKLRQRHNVIPLLLIIIFFTFFFSFMIHHLFIFSSKR